MGDSNTIDKAFEELKALSEKKGYLLFADVEKISECLSVNEVDRLCNHLLTLGIEIFENVPETIKNSSDLKQPMEKGHLASILLFLKYKALHATGRRIDGERFIVHKGSEYNAISTSSCTAAIEKIRSQLIRTGRMKNGVLTEDIEFRSPSTAAKVLIGNSVNGNIVWMDLNGHTLKELLTEK